MSICIVEHPEEDVALFYCDTSGWAFGPVMESADEAEAFLAWCGPRLGDIRSASDPEVNSELRAFRASRSLAEGPDEDVLTYRIRGER